MLGEVQLREGGGREKKKMERVHARVTAEGKARIPWNSVPVCGGRIGISNGEAEKTGKSRKKFPGKGLVCREMATLAGTVWAPKEDPQLGVWK